MPPVQRRVLVIGGAFGGLACGRDLHNHFLVTIVDAKEFFEYTPGVLRAYVKPKHLDALTFTLQPVIEERMGCKFVWGEVTSLDGPNRTCTLKPMFADAEETIDFDYCIIASGCNFGPFHKWGQSLWFPTIHEKARPEGDWPHLDERFLEGRRRHILEEYASLQAMNEKNKKVLVVGAGFIGVEWVTELEHFFKNLKLSIMDFLPNCLGPLPAKAATYCSKYMEKKGIKTFYKTGYEPKNPTFWKNIMLGDGTNIPDESELKQYVCIGVKASNYFMPDDCLSATGPGGGKWILNDIRLAVMKTTKGEKNDPVKGIKPIEIGPREVWAADDKGYPRVYAIGDCNNSCVDEPGKKPEEWPIPPIPKISYPGEEEGIVACTNIHKTDKILFHGKKVDAYGWPLELSPMHWPWGAGMFATSLGPDDACFVAGANWVKNSGLMCVWGSLCAVQKEIIEASKTDECAFGLVGRCIWYFVHHTPLHLWGGGPRFGY